MTRRYLEIERAARVLGVKLRSHVVRVPDDFDSAFAAISHEHPDALLLVSDALTTSHRRQILDFATAQRVPTMFEFASLVREGGLMSYGPDLDESFRRAAVYVDRILKGAKPGDMPVEQPKRYILLVNLKTAKALGLVIPQSLLVRADEVIQ
jgi:putative ABC transport system substrate-binding protein